MADRDNLIPFNNRSENEARELGKKGGKKSGEIRRKNKSIREALLAVLKGEYDIEGVVICGYDAIALKAFNEALNGNIQAFKEIRDTIGEKPTDKLDLASNGSRAKDIKISFVDKSTHNFRTETDPKIVGEYTPPTNINGE